MALPTDCVTVDDLWDEIRLLRGTIDTLQREIARLETKCQEQADFICDQGREIERLR